VNIKYVKRVYDFEGRSVVQEDGSYPSFTYGEQITKGRDRNWFFLRYILPILAWFWRRFFPVFRFPKFGIFSGIFFVSRREDIEKVLNNKDGDFGVPYSPEMRQLGGKDNVLSLDGIPHDALLDDLRNAFKKEDIDKVAKWVLDDANSLLDAGAGRIDIFRDLITRTATESCCRLFGLSPENPEEFALWSFAISQQIFADYELSENSWVQAQVAAAHLRTLIQDGIDRIHWNNNRHPNSTRERTTIIDRLVTDSNMTDSDVIATIIGLLTAFVPTDTLAAGNMLDVITSKSRMRKRAVSAAKNGNREEMRNVILEAGRLFPALSPGLFRLVKKPTQIRGKSLKAGDIVLALIPSGLRDKRNRNPSAVSDSWLMFGYGPHICLGAELSLAHITSVFMALFAREDLKPVAGKTGKLQKIGTFHDRQDYKYKSIQARGGHVVMTFPVRAGVDRGIISKNIKTRIGNPAKEQIRDSFWKETDLEYNDYGRVQFSSLSVVELEPNSKESILIFELNGDGDPDSLIQYVSRKCDIWLRPLIEDFITGGDAIKQNTDLSKFLRKHATNLHFKPWGTTGLLFEGLPGLTVKDIFVNNKIAGTTRKIIDQYLQLGYYKLELRGAHIMRRAKRVIARDNLLMLRKHWRRILNDREFDVHNPELEIAPGRSSIIRPSRSQLPLTNFTSWEKKTEPAPKVFSDPINKFIWVFIVLAILSLWLLLTLISSAGWALTLVTTLLAFFPILILVFCVFKYKLNKLESTDFVDDEPANINHVSKLVELENPANHEHNHIVAVMPFKKGIFRRLTFSFTMWGIYQTVKHWFRPGFVVTMGTIYVARWFRIKGTNIFAFLSNYDGSWESYLEDFITRANQGQSAAWSHGVGFPRTKNLIEKGAADGDNFKRWVRKQQRETLFWYSRFPEMTTEQIRRDTMIVEGLSKSVSDTDAKRWLGLFGSEQRQSRELETQEIQSLVFTGFPKQSLATTLLIKLPLEKQKIAEYLRALAGIQITLDGIVDGSVPFANASFSWADSNSKTTKIKLPLSARIRFSDDPVEHGGIAFGFSSAGLLKAGLEGTGAQKSFPYAFNVGMGKRAKVLGDDETRYNEWRFSDNLDLPQGAETVMIIYGNEPGSTHESLVEHHKHLLSLFGGSIIHKIPCKPVEIANPNKKGGAKISSLKHEHFGFRDGISQPAIQNTSKSEKAPERDIVAPGEFILGYQNHQGYTSTPISLGSIFDSRQTLSNYTPDQSSDFPYFGISTPKESQRDFGRNGYYLAIRQLDQDVEGFEKEMVRVADNLKSDYEDSDEVAGGNLDSKWVAAKIIGRWQDGTPLVRNKTCPLNIPLEEEPNNDFTYGEDDPRGHACPLGSHIRRTNPRDSMEPGNYEEQLITNRHRLLRRGRSYEYRVGPVKEGVTSNKGGDVKKGLLFMSVCGDIERQFEFVQRTWINKTSFHGLKGEHDPLMGGASSSQCKNGNPYTIPTPSGPLQIPDLKSFVTLQGGGYFFMPSRASLAFLINRSE